MRHQPDAKENVLIMTRILIAIILVSIVITASLATVASACGDRGWWYGPDINAMGYLRVGGSSEWLHAESSPITRTTPVTNHQTIVPGTTLSFKIARVNNNGQLYPHDLPPYDMDELWDYPDYDDPCSRLDESVTYSWVLSKKNGSNWDPDPAVYSDGPTLNPINVLTTHTRQFNASDVGMWRLEWYARDDGLHDTSPICTGYTDSENDSSDEIDRWGRYEITVTNPPAINIGNPTPNVTSNGPVSYMLSYSGADTITLKNSDISINRTGTANGKACVIPTILNLKTHFPSSQVENGLRAEKYNTETREISLLPPVVGGYEDVSGQPIVASTAPEDQNCIYLRPAAGNLAASLSYQAPMWGLGRYNYSLQAKCRYGSTHISIFKNDGSEGIIQQVVASGGTTKYLNGYVDLFQGEYLRIAVDNDGGGEASDGTELSGTITIPVISSYEPTVTIYDTEGDGTIGFSLASGTANIGGIQAPSAGPSATFDVDNTAPAFTNISANPNHADVDTDVAISFDVADILPENPSADNPLVKVNDHTANFVSKDQDGGIYTYTYTYQIADASTDLPGPATITISGTDRVGHTGSVTDTDALFVGEPTPLTVTINQQSTQQDPTSISPIKYDVVFSESVSDFTDSDVHLESASGTAIALVTGSVGANYTVEVTGMTSDCNVTATIPEGVAHTTGGLGNTASTSNDNQVTFDYTQASVSSVTSDNDDNHIYTSGEIIDIKVVFSEPVTYTENPQLELETGAGVSRFAICISGDGTNTLIFRYAVQDGDNCYDLNYANTNAFGGSIKDIAGNSAITTLPDLLSEHSLAGNRNLILRTDPPIVKITNPSGGEINMAPEQNTVQFVGTIITDFEVTSIQVGFTAADSSDEPEMVPYPSNGVEYNQTTHVWTYNYNWTSPQPQKIWVKVTAGKTTTISKVVTVSTLSVVKYVRPSGTGDGSSWESATGSIQAAIDVADGGEVWVAEGVYEEYITLDSGVAIYGGFAPADKYRERRNWQSHTTVLEGTGSNTIVNIEDNASAETIIDGFTIQGGMDGVSCGVDSFPRISHNRIINNNYHGIISYDGSPIIINNIIKDNYCGIECSGYTTQIINNTITHNDCGISIYFADNATITNNILTGNQVGILNFSLVVDGIHHNCVYGNDNDQPELFDPQLHNIEVDPKLYGDHIQHDSPCVDAGDNSVADDCDVDIDDQARKQNAVVDIGADESNGCDWYTVNFAATIVGNTVPGSDAQVEAVVTGANGRLIPHHLVRFAVSSNGSLESPVSAEAYTNGQGRAIAIVRPSVPGTLTVTATIDQPEPGEPAASASMNITSKSVVYVSKSGSDTNSGIGGWSNAVLTITKALGLSVSGEEVWVAAGSYKESQLTVKSGVGLYGGFLGNETNRVWRRFDKTILYGVSDSTVISTEINALTSTVIDGFTIFGGSKGVYCPSGRASITNNQMIGNDTGLRGDNTNVVISNNVIRGNGTYGIHCVNGDPCLTNNTIVKNGDGINVTYATISNNIVALNKQGVVGGGNLRNNCVYSNPIPNPDPNNKDYVSCSAGTEDISADPKLATDYIHLQPDSPCIDAGKNDALSIYPTDVDLQPRFVKVTASDTRIDIGADESTGSPVNLSRRIVRVTTQGNDNNDGSAWDSAHAMKSVRSAVDALLATGGEVWVAAGMYDQEHIALSGDIQLYGGFAGLQTETDISQRNSNINTVILDGGLVSGHSVIKAVGSWNCLIDGFTIQRGSSSKGAGISCRNCSSITISNNTIVNNSADYGGGIECYASKVTITDNHINNNTSAEYGSAIYSGASYTTISNNKILNNTSNTNNDYNKGGTICIAGDNEVVISNNWINGNTGSSSSIRLDCISAVVFISNNTISSNPAGGILCRGYSSPSSVNISNNVIYSNSFGINEDSSMVVVLHNNCVFSNASNYFGISIPPTEKQIDPELTEDGLHLHSYSPCIDAGDDDEVYNDYDIDGNPRKISILAAREDDVDIGADELDKLSASIILAQSPNCKTIHATWRQYSGDVQNYYYAIGTSPTATDISDWAIAGGPTNSELTVDSYNLSHSGTYYFLLKVLQPDGQWSEVDSKQIEIGPNTLVLNAVPTNAAVGSPVQVTATVRNHFDDPIDMDVHFDTSSGIVDNPVVSTGSDGEVSVQIQNACQGAVNVSAYIIDACGNRVDALPTTFNVIANTLTLDVPASVAVNTVTVTATVKDHNNNPLQRLVHFSVDSGDVEYQEKLSGTDGKATIQISNMPNGIRSITAYIEDDCHNKIIASGTVNVDTTPICVKDTGNDANSGRGWSQAKKTVQAGINAIEGSHEVWVAVGNHKAETTSQRIVMKSGIKLYGGFIGTETSLEQRNWNINQTILDGGGIGPTLKLSNVTGCEINGFVIRNGSNTKGGGIYCTNASATLANNIIRSNNGDNGWGGIGGSGGGLYASSSNLVVVGNVFMKNSANNGGGIFFCEDTTGMIANNTIISNSGNSNGGGIYLDLSSSLSLYNNIVYANNGGGIYKATSGTLTVTKNIVHQNNGYDYHGIPDTSGDIILSTETDLGMPYIENSDWHIASNSPCVDTGDNSVVQSEWTDIDGLERQFDGDEDSNEIVDIGADEWNGVDPSPKVIYVKPISQGGSDSIDRDGTTWENAVATVQRGIDLAYNVERNEVWVAACGNDEPYSKINLESSVRLYGGFAIGDTTKDARDWRTNQTILDGGASGSTVSLDTVNGCVVDGFVIRNGSSTNGGGIYCYNASANIANNIIRANDASSFGGGLRASLSSLAVIGNVFVSNRALCGGGIAIDHTNGQIANNTIISNTATTISGGGGGGIEYSQGSESLTLANNIIASNIGGGVYSYNGSVTFAKNIVYQNTMYEYRNIPIPTDYDIILSSGTDLGMPNVEYGDWHIASDSPCRNQGVSAPNIPIPDKDIDTKIRIHDTLIDIGADEWNGSDPLYASASFLVNCHRLLAEWRNMEPAQEYFYAVGTSIYGTEVQSWTSIGTASSLDTFDVSLIGGNNYYLTIEATNSSGNRFQIGSTKIFIYTQSDTLILDTSSTTVLEGEEFSVIANAKDYLNNPVTGRTVTFVITNGTDTLSTSSVETVNGVAAVNVTVPCGAGDQLVVQVTMQSSFCSEEITNSVIVPISHNSTLTLSANPNPVSENGSTIISAVLKNARNEVVSNKDVSFFVTRGTGDLSVTTSKTDTNGLVTTTVSNSCGGDGRLDIEASSIDACSRVINSIISVPVCHDTLALESNKTSTAVGGDVTITATVKNSQDTAIEGRSVAFDIITGTGSPSTISALTGTDGKAEVTISDLCSTTGFVTVKGSMIRPFGGEIAKTSSIQLPPDILVVSANPEKVDSSGSSDITALVKDSNGQPIINRVVTFTITTGSGNLSATSVNTDSSGVAQITASALRGSLGQVAVKVAIQCCGSEISKNVLLAVGHDTISLAANPIRVSSDGNTQIIATVKNSGGQPVVGRAVSLVITTGSGQLSATSINTNSSGVAQVDVSYLCSATGFVFIKATMNQPGYGDILDSVAVQIDKDLMELVANPNPSGTDRQTEIKATIIHGVAPVVGRNVSFEIIMGAGNPMTTSAFTDGSGVAIAPIEDINIEGEEKLIVKASTGDSCGGIIERTVDVLLSKDTLELSATPNPALLGIDRTITATVKDSSGAVIIGRTITFTIINGSGDLSSTAVDTNQDGVATTTISNLCTDAGEVVVQASMIQPNVGEITNTVSLMFDHDQIGLSANPGTVLDGGQSKITATLRDSQNNIITGRTVTVTFVVDGGYGNLSETSVDTDTGIAETTISGLSSSNGKVTVRAYTLQECYGDINCSVDVEVPKYSILLSASPNPVSIGGVTIITATVKDSSGVAVANCPVDFAVIGGSADLSSVSVNTNTNGIANITISNLCSNEGQVIVKASMHSYVEEITNSLTVPLNHDNIALIINPTAVVSHGTVQAIATVSGGQISGRNVIFTLLDGSGNLSASSVTTNSSGVAQITISNVTSISGQLIVKATVEQFCYGEISNKTPVTVNQETLTLTPDLWYTPAGNVIILKTIAKDASGSFINGRKIKFNVIEEPCANSAILQYTEGETVNGEASTSLVCGMSGYVTVQASMEDSNQERIITVARVNFYESKPPAIHIVFVIDSTGSMSSGQDAASGIRDTVEYLKQTAGDIWMHGIKYNNATQVNWYPSGSADHGGFTQNYDSFVNNWVLQAWGNGGTEWPLHTMLLAKDKLLSVGATNKIIALATDEDWDDIAPTEPAYTAGVLKDAGCRVFIDPDDDYNLANVYKPLAVNDGAVETDLTSSEYPPYGSPNIGTYKFKRMRMALTGGFKLPSCVKLTELIYDPVYDTISAAWKDPGESDRFQYAIGTDAYKDDVISWNELGSDETSVTFESGLEAGDYFFSIRALNTEGIPLSGDVRALNIPALPLLKIDSAIYIQETKKVAASWTFAGPVADYEYSIGSSERSDDVLSWTHLGSLDTEVEADASNITSMDSYYFNVRALDAGGTQIRGDSYSFFAIPSTGGGDPGNPGNPGSRDVITFSASPSQFAPDGSGNIFVTVHVQNAGKNVQGRELQFAVQDGIVSHETAYTRWDGTAEVQVHPDWDDQHEWVNMTVSEVDPIYGNISESIDLYFPAVPEEAVIFIMNNNNHWNLGREMYDGIAETAQKIHEIAPWVEFGFLRDGFSSNDYFTPCDSLNPHRYDIFIRYLDSAFSYECGDGTNIDELGSLNFAMENLNYYGNPEDEARVVKHYCIASDFSYHASDGYCNACRLSINPCPVQEHPTSWIISKHLAKGDKSFIYVDAGDHYQQWLDKWDGTQNVWINTPDGWSAAGYNPAYTLPGRYHYQKLIDNIKGDDNLKIYSDSNNNNRIDDNDANASGSGKNIPLNADDDNYKSGATNLPDYNENDLPDGVEKEDDLVAVAVVIGKNNFNKDVKLIASEGGNKIRIWTTKIKKAGTQYTLGDSLTEGSKILYVEGIEIGNVKLVLSVDGDIKQETETKFVVTPFYASPSQVRIVQGIKPGIDNVVFSAGGVSVLHYVTGGTCTFNVTSVKKLDDNDEIVEDVPRDQIVWAIIDPNACIWEAGKTQKVFVPLPVTLCADNPVATLQIFALSSCPEGRYLLQVEAIRDSCVYHTDVLVKVERKDIILMKENLKPTGDGNGPLRKIQTKPGPYIGTAATITLPAINDQRVISCNGWFQVSLV